MSLRDVLVTSHAALDGAGIDHALIGGMALAVHGINRATGDVDFLIDGACKQAAQTALTAVGFTLFHETDEVLQLAGRGKLDLLLARRPLSRAMLATAKVVPSLGVKCLAVEDIIGLKIQAYKNAPRRELQDKADIQALIAQHASLDWAKIQSYAELFGEWSEIQRIRGLP